jgi:hypothetical protein
MDGKRLHGHRFTLAGYGPATALPVLLLAFSLLLFSPAVAATDNSKAGTFEERTAAERMSRSRYRNLEVASLVVILAAGGGAIYWAISRRKP